MTASSFIIVISEKGISFFGSVAHLHLYNQTTINLTDYPIFLYDYGSFFYDVSH